MRLADKVAIVTGAGQGIGREYARTLAKEGAKVVIAELNPDTGQQVSEEINELSGTATYLPLDLASEQSCHDLAQATIKHFGGIDILVNNGAIYHGMRRDSFSTVSLEYFEEFMAVNMTGQMLMTRSVVPSMRERGGGKIIFQSSGAAYVAGSSPYSLSKLAVVGLTRGFAAELGPDNINVNCIAPGPIDTESTRVTVDPEILEHLVSKMPLRRMGKPQDLQGALLFLASNDSDFMTGQVLLIDGGEDRRL